MHPLSWAIVLAVVNIPVYAVVGALFFRTVDEFRQAVRFRPVLGFVSLFRGESRKELAAELKVVLFMAVCAATVYCEYLAIQVLVQR